MKAIRQVSLIFILSFIASLGFVLLWKDTVKLRGYPVGFDIYLRWAGARAFWQGQSPYSPDVTARSDLLIYGRLRADNEISYDFYDPAYAAIVLWPLTLIPFEWAGIGWSALGFAILLTLIVYWSWSLQPRPKPLLWGLIVFSGLLYRPAWMTILNGQYSLFLVGCAVVVWWLIVRKHDLPAGMVLAIGTIKPSIFLFAPLVVALWAFRWKRWSIIWGFIGTLAIFGVISFVKIGWWIPDFLARLAAYGQMGNGQIGFSWSPGYILSPLGLLWLGQSLVLTGIGLWRLWRRDEFPSLAVVAAINLNLIVSPHIVEYDLGILLISLLWLGMEWAKGRWGMVALVLLLWFPWLSWGLVLGIGGSTLVWQDLVWEIFPNLILFFTLAWLMIRNKPAGIYT
jgi:hypothetical protein